MSNKFTKFMQELFLPIYCKQEKETMVNLLGNLTLIMVENTNRDYEMGDKAFTVKDYACVRSVEDLANLSEKERTMQATAYAISNGVTVFNNGSSPYYLRNAHSMHAVNYVCANGVIYDSYVNDQGKGCCCGIRLNLRPLKGASKLPLGYGKVNQKKHTIEFSYWPNELVDDLNQYEELLHDGKMTDTGIWYFGAMQKRGKFTKNKMYKYNGEYFVRVKQSGGKAMWHRLNMIEWKVLDEKKWNSLPRLINPEGDGTADYLDVYPENLIDAGKPFYPNQFEENNSFYQNSTLRNYLNGYNGADEEMNGGNLKYPAKNGGDFTDCGFVQQITSVSFDVLKTLTDVKEEYKNKNLKMQTLIKRPNEIGMTL